MREGQGHMRNNINMAMDNIVKTDELSDKTEEMQRRGQQFHTDARTAKRKMCFKNMKLNVLIAAVVIVIVIWILSKLGLGGGDSYDANCVEACDGNDDCLEKCHR